MLAKDDDLTDDCLDLLCEVEMVRREKRVKCRDFPEHFPVTPSAWYGALRRGDCKLSTLVGMAKGLGYRIRITVEEENDA